MNVVVVSGIWPPDVGGPATHAPEVARFLHDRRHGVEVVVTADAQPPSEPFAVNWTSRRLPAGVRHAVAAAAVARAARRADVVYATGMITRAALGSTLARRPYVLKLTADPAFERMRRRGLFGGTLDEFQRSSAGRLTPVLRRTRNTVVRGAAHVICPSAYLCGLASTWGARTTTVLPNPAPDVPALPPRDQLRDRFGFHGPTLAFAGRLTAAKSLDVALAALARTEGIALAVAGEGEAGTALRRRAGELGLDSRVRFLGAQPRRQVLELFRAADAAVLSSSWENFPHALVEALAVGTPVIATRVGGVPEIVADGENGLLVPPGDPEALAGAISRFFDGGALAGRLRIAAAPSAERFSSERLLERLVELLEDAAARARDAA